MNLESEPARCPVGAAGPMRTLSPAPAIPSIMMMSRVMVCVGLLELGPAALPTAADAGQVIVVGPPAILAPPVIVGPPVVYVAPRVAVEPAPRVAKSCSAGAYVCPLQHAASVGSSCSCPTDGTSRASGRAR